MITSGEIVDGAPANGERGDERVERAVDGGGGSTGQSRNFLPSAGIALAIGLYGGAATRKRVKKRVRPGAGMVGVVRGLAWTRLGERKGRPIEAGVGREWLRGCDGGRCLRVPCK